RTAVAAAVVALVAGVVGLGAVAGVQARANSALRKANDATTKALIQVRNEQVKTQAALSRATGEEQKAKQSAAEAKAVIDCFQEKVLAAARPEGEEGGLGKDVTIRKAVAAAEPKITAAFKDQPTVEASIRDALGMTYLFLGELALAISQHERALAARTAKLG